MTQNVRFGLIAIALLTLVWLMTQMGSISATNVKLEEKLITLQSSASHFAILKKRWAKKGVAKKLLQRLEKVKAFDKRFLKASNEVIVYKSLTAKMFDRISYMIFASDVLLVDVKINKEGGLITLRVEMKS